MPKNAQSTPFAKLKMILQKLDNFHEPFGQNKSGGLWLSGTVHALSRIQEHVAKSYIKYVSGLHS